jgi:4-carboxymuconolactone decarboxylase
MGTANYIPENFKNYKGLFEKMFSAFENGAELARSSGPLEKKITHLVQLAAAIGVRSEGAVHSHARQALEAGASMEELYHVVNLMISTLGFPAAAAAFSWINDDLKAREGAQE